MTLQHLESLITAWQAKTKTFEAVVPHGSVFASPIGWLGFLPLAEMNVAAQANEVSKAANAVAAGFQKLFRTNTRYHFDGRAYWVDSDGNLWVGGTGNS